jgi:hypothetical protein
MTAARSSEHWPWENVPPLWASPVWSFQLRCGSVQKQYRVVQGTKKSTQLDDMFVMFSSAIHGGYVVLHHVPEISWVVATWDAVPNPIALCC